MRQRQAECFLWGRGGDDVGMWVRSLWKRKSYTCAEKTTVIYITVQLLGFLKTARKLKVPCFSLRKGLGQVRSVGSMLD